MEPNYEFFLSVLEQDRCAVVLCDLEHEIVYMNPAARVNYQKWGGGALVGRSLLDCHNQASREHILQVVAWFGESKNNNLVHTFYNEMQHKDGYMVALRNPAGKLIGYYEKHEYRDRETRPLYALIPDQD